MQMRCNLQVLQMHAHHRISSVTPVACSGAQGMDAGQAEAQAALQAALAEKAETEGKLAGLEERLEALETENAQLESMKARLLFFSPKLPLLACDG